MNSGLLIASPQMRDPNFERTVILLCQFDEEGAIGVVINRSAPITVRAVTDEVKLPPPSHGTEQAWWGGPVGRGTCFVIWRGQTRDDEGWTVGTEVAISQSLERLEQLIQANRHFHVSIGYAGWAPEQLIEEIERGSWLYVEADPELIFETPMASRYDHALALLGLTASTVIMQPGDA